MQSISKCLFIFGFTLLFGCGVKQSDTVTAVPGPQPTEAPAPIPSPGPQPSEKVFSIQLDSSEAPTQFKVNQQGEIRVAAAPEILTGKMVRTRPQFGRLPLTEERCARVDRMTLDVLSFRDSADFAVSFRSVFQHLRTSESVEFKVQLPTLFRLDEDQFAAEQIKRQAFAYVDQGRFSSLHQLKLVDLPSLKSSETQAIVGALAWSSRMDGARVRGGATVSESVTIRVELHDLFEGRVAFSEIDFLCDVAAERSALESIVEADRLILSPMRVNWKLALGNAP